jgi:hypothetical protein
MDAAGYRTLFDVTEAGYRAWYGPAIGLIFVAVGIFLPRSKKKYPPWFRWAFLGFSVIWTTLVFVGTYGEYRLAVSAMREGKAKIVEGVVTEFSSSSKGRESFAVHGARFEYSDRVVIAGFHTTASNGGPMRAGMQVKIWYLYGQILRLDEKEGANQIPEPTSGLAPGHGSS